MTRLFTHLRNCLPVLLIAVSACQQHPNKNAPDIAKMSADTLAANIEKRVFRFFQENNPGETARVLDSLKPSVDKQNAYVSTYAWYRYKGLHFRVQSKLDSAEFYYQKALDISLAHDSLRKIMHSKTALSEVLNEQKKIDSALMHAKDAYLIAQKIDTAKLPGMLVQLVSCYSYIGDLDQYRKYSFKGLELSRKSSSHLRPFFELCINSYYSSKNLRDSALYWYHNVVEKDTAMENISNHTLYYANKGLMLSYENKDEEALKYHLKVLEIDKEQGFEDPNIFFNTGVSYRKLKKYQLAEEYLKKALRLASVGRKEIMTDVWKETALLYADQHRWSEALAAKDSAYENNKRITDASFAGKAREIEARYAVKSKDDEIRTLAVSNEANRRISAQQKTIILILAGAFLLAAVLGIALWRRRKLSEKLRQAELEQRLLRSQMEPHFIFNTLSVLQSYIRNNESEKAVRYLNQFARLLRVTLENSRESFVPLKEEVSALENYLSLQSMRFPELFEYEVITWPMYEEEGLLIPPMLLQPFVENAILHGMKQLHYKGHISVLIQKEAHVLRCSIRDNGAGWQTTPAVQSGKQSLSTTITRERLAILSRQTGYPAGITVINGTGETQGTHIELCIPFRKANPFSGYDK